MDTLFDVVEDLGKRLGDAFVAAFESSIGTLDKHSAKPHAVKANGVDRRNTTKRGRKSNPDAQRNKPCIVPNCKHNGAAHKLCQTHYHKAKHFKIDLTSKIPARLLKLLATDGRKVDLKVLAGGKSKQKVSRTKTTRAERKRAKANSSDVVPVGPAQAASTKAPF